MRTFLLAGVAALGLTMTATTAGAAVVGTITTPVPIPNEVMNPLTLIEGWYNANLYLVGGPVQITATLIGYEAGFTNTFRWTGPGGGTLAGGNGTLGTLGNPINTSFSINNVLSGLLPFQFESSGSGGVVNGSNRARATGPNFFVTLGTGCAGVLDLSCIDTTAGNGTPGSGQIAWLWYDDQPTQQDDNHDDLVIRLEITGGSFEVPEPASLAVLGMGLLGLGFASRRRAKKA